MTGLRLMTALAVMLGMLSWGNHSISSHGPGMVLAAADADHGAAVGLDEDHVHEGHVHDEDPGEEPHSDPVHGHNPADHSHVAMSFVAAPAMFTVAARAAWQGGASWAEHGEPLYFLDRPPRSGAAT
ncbi:hypothetical protein [Azospirillum sp. SYSU D00513]|uniref:hypothetical protein n=1 Tax=Azospirillum sp. SYSU D00513 TaxID=2812561 RepID=UPI001A95C9CE|nr:hypothetical protein [Azospirillum sp. SYSU D00513]